jgi:hypothetical protein
METSVVNLRPLRPRLLTHQHVFARLEHAVRTPAIDTDDATMQCRWSRTCDAQFQADRQGGRGDPGCTMTQHSGKGARCARPWRGVACTRPLVLRDRNRISRPTDSDLAEVPAACLILSRWPRAYPDGRGLSALFDPPLLNPTQPNL